jgi:hypothetical protein
MKLRRAFYILSWVIFHILYNYILRSRIKCHSCQSGLNPLILLDTFPKQRGLYRHRKTIYLVLWSDRLTLFLEDASSNSLRGHELGSLTNMEDLWGQVFYSGDLDVTWCTL